MTDIADAASKYPSASNLVREILLLFLFKQCLILSFILLSMAHLLFFHIAYVAATFTSVFIVSSLIFIFLVLDQDSAACPFPDSSYITC